jgi:TonB family protein
MPSKLTKQLNKKLRHPAAVRYGSACLLAALLTGAGSGAAHSHGFGQGRGFGQIGGQRQAQQNQTNRANGPKPLPLTIRDKWAVMVGVAHYQDGGIKPIKYAARNVLTLTEALCDPQVGHFLPDHVLVATEDKVTKDALADSTWQGWLSKKALPNDMIVLYFCMRFVPADDASDLLLLTQESKLAQKEMTATSLSSILGEVRRRTQCKNIIVLLDISPTEQTAKNFPYGFSSLLQSIGKKAGVTILSADERLLGSLDDDGPARASVFVEYFCQALRAGGGTLSIDYMASYLSQILAQQAPAKAGGYNSHPILLACADNPELVKMPLGLAVKHPNSLTNVRIGRPISQIALTDPALAAHLTELAERDTPLQKISQLKNAAYVEEDDQQAGAKNNAGTGKQFAGAGKEFAGAGKEDAGAGKKDAGAGKDDAGKKDAGKNDAGKNDAGKKDAGKKDAGKNDANKEDQDQQSGQDVDFTPYMAKMKKTIQSKWAPPKSLNKKIVVAVFNIQKDGRISDPEIVESSGSSPIDQSALKALTDASPLAPLPKGSPKRVQIRFKFDWKVSE